MTKTIMLICTIVAGLIMSACSSNSTPAPTRTPIRPTATTVKILPTPSDPGDSVMWESIQVRLDQIEYSNEFETEYGFIRIPPEGAKFMWVHIQLKNTGQIEIDLPALEHFSILYAATEIKPTYGHRKDYAEYSTLGATLFPDQTVDGWLRFDIPLTAESADLRFVFLPESSHVGASYGSPNYPYGDDKPTFVWNCE